MEELYRQVDKYSTLEDNIRAAAQIVMITNQTAEKDKSTGNKFSTSKEGQNGNQKRPQDQSHKKKKEPLQLTPLNILYDRLFPLICDLPDFKCLAPIQTDPSQRNKTLRCYYHKDHGHKTDRCRSLKFLVEKVIKARHLRRYLKEDDQGVESGRSARRIVASQATPSEPRPIINYILGGLADDLQGSYG